MSIEDLIEKRAKDVKGEKNAEDNILIFTLSTCMWCKKCKRFLDDRKMKYRYIDVDNIDKEEKSRILDYLKSNFQQRISYPFLICEKGFVVGYNPNMYEELLES
ncbi:MAG: glutaredoxin family protein [Promethearchaeota archaeon]|jgi:glutaredoxin